MTAATHSELELEAIRICQELIRIPSVNFGDGKGDEKDVAAHVVKLLSEVGIVSQTYESAPGRCNVIARIKGSNPNRPGLVVHGHFDVVPANAADWSVDPFAAEIKDGYIWVQRDRVDRYFLPGGVARQTDEAGGPGGGDRERRGGSSSLQRTGEGGAVGVPSCQLPETEK